ncbi:30S ribosomal protein S5 [bacterium]|nr:30S ribosomal protein S5 [bacterium]
MALTNNNTNNSRSQEASVAEEKKYEEKVVQVSRVSKKTKGGNQFGFSILVVVGDKKGRVGVGLGKGKDVLSSIKKAVKKARKNMISVPMDGTTIPFPVRVKKGAAKVLLKPAPKGSGVIAGGAVRSVVEAAGIRDLSAKILGTNNQASNVYATFTALKQMEKMVELKGIKLKSIVEIEAEEAKKFEEEAAKAKAAEKGKQEASKKNLKNGRSGDKAKKPVKDSKDKKGAKSAAVKKAAKPAAKSAPSKGEQATPAAESTK